VKCAHPAHGASLEAIPSECGSLPVGERNCQRFTVKGLSSKRSL
jgi:hypothetical protein